MLFICAILAGCGGAASSTTPTAPSSAATTSAVATAVPVPSVAPFSASQEIGATSGQLNLPVISGFSGTFSLSGAAVPSGTTIAETLTNQAPSDAPVLTAAARNNGMRSTLSEGPSVVIEYVEISPSQTISVPAYPSFSLMLPPQDVLSGAFYYLAAFDSSAPSAGWQVPFEGPATSGTGNVLIFTGASRTFTLTANVRYYFALLAFSTNATPSPLPSPTFTAAPTAFPTVSPTATAAPTATATATATAVATATATALAGSPVVLPSSIAFTAAGQTAVLKVSQANFSGSFSATTANAAIATVTSADASTFVVTAGSTSGNVNIVITNSGGMSTTIPITVTITQGSIN